MADRGKRKKEKEGKTEIQIFVYLDNEKSLLDEIKIIFRNYLRAEKKNKENSGHKVYSLCPLYFC